MSRKGREYEKVKTTYVQFEDYESGKTPLPTKEEALAGLKSCQSVPKLFSQIKAFLMQINGSGSGGSGIAIPVLTEPITKTIEITDLQSELDVLPKLLMADVTFNVNAGTYDGEILIEKFVGSGTLTINGANKAGQTSHNILGMKILNCGNQQIVIQGLNATATADNVFSMWCCLGTAIYLCYCNSTVGNNTTVGLYGMSIVEVGSVYIQECTISNKYVALRVFRGTNVTVLDLYGTNNREVYAASKGGTIHKESAGTIVGTYLNNQGAGGLIINYSGGTLGS